MPRVENPEHYIRQYKFQYGTYRITPNVCSLWYYQNIILQQHLPKTMKPVVYSFLYLILTTICIAQPPVTLEEWFSLRYGIEPYFSTLSKFGIENQEHITLLRRCYNSGTYCESQTWFNRYAGDTVNQFTWGRYLPEGLVSLDFNGDGNSDYINNMGVLMMSGLGNMPDTGRKYPFPEHPHIRAGSRKNTYGDVNGDGKDDIFYYHHASNVYPYLITIVFGSADMSTLRTTKVASPQLSDTTIQEVSVVMYKNKQGKWRLITNSYAVVFSPIPPPGRYFGIPEKAAIKMYDVSIQPKQDSNIVILTLLDTYKDPDWLNSQFMLKASSPVGTDGGGLIYNSEIHSKLYLYSPTFKYDRNNELQFETHIFNLTNDKLTFIEKNNAVGLMPDAIVLDHSVTGNSTNDLVSVIGKTLYVCTMNDDSYIPNRYFSWKVPDGFGGLITDVYSLSDVTSDGIHDIALMVPSSFVGNAFFILKGKDWKTVGVHDDEVRSITTTLGNPYPEPQSSSELYIPVHIPQAGLFTLELFSMEGKLIATIQQATANKAQDVVVPFSTSGIESGVYMIRLTNGSHHTARVVVITK
ncbi:MAG: T9SS type A sorting domain-containing protein [Candidatus Kapaibacterium sp.]